MYNRNTQGNHFSSGLSSRISGCKIIILNINNLSISVRIRPITAFVEIIRNALTTTYNSFLHFLHVSINLDGKMRVEDVRSAPRPGAVLTSATSEIGLVRVRPLRQSGYHTDISSRSPKNVTQALAAHCSGLSCHAAKS